MGISSALVLTDPGMLFPFITVSEMNQDLG